MAEGILEAGVAEIVGAAASVARKLGYLREGGEESPESARAFPLVLAGGLLTTAGSGYAERLRRALARGMPEAVPLAPEVEPAVAAALVALQLTSTH